MGIMMVSCNVRRELARYRKVADEYFALGGHSERPFFRFMYDDMLLFMALNIASDRLEAVNAEIRSQQEGGL